MTVYCELSPGMGLGNQLWNIMATLGIAQKTGQTHCIAGYEHFKGKGFLEVNTDTKYGPPGGADIYWEASYFHRKEKFYFNIFDESLYEFAASGADCVIKGLLQDERYLAGRLEIQFIAGPFIAR